MLLLRIEKKMGMNIPTTIEPIFDRPIEIEEY
jgi:hypothetical protein